MPALPNKYQNITPQIGKNKHQKIQDAQWNIIFEDIIVKFFSNLKFKSHD
jgi:hypothetical protein